MALKWKDNKDVVMLSTYHDAKMTVVRSYRGEKEKPQDIVEYNQHMGAVDVSDQMLVAYPLSSETKAQKNVVEEDVRTFAQPNSAQKAKSRKQIFSHGFSHSAHHSTACLVP